MSQIPQSNPLILSDLIANQPAAGTVPPNSLFYATDTATMYICVRDTVAHTNSWVALALPSPTGATGGSVTGILMFAGGTDDSSGASQYLACSPTNHGTAGLKFGFASAKRFRNLTVNLLANPSGVVHTVSLLGNSGTLVSKNDVGPATGGFSLAGPWTLNFGSTLDLAVQANTQNAGTALWSATLEVF